MKRRLFFPHNIGLHLLSLLFFAMGYASVYLCIDTIVLARWRAIDVVVLVLALIWLIMMEHLYIFLNHDTIDVPDDWLNKNMKIQYKISVPYNTVKELSYSCETTNSRGKSIKSFSAFSIMSKPYLNLVDEEGKVERIFLWWYTKRQRKKLIRELFARCPNCVSDLDAVLNIVDATKAGMFIVPDQPFRKMRSKKSTKKNKDKRNNSNTD